MLGPIAFALLLPQSPTLVADIDSSEINPGSNPVEFVELDGNVLFSADFPNLGRELWSSDGTAGGTGMVADLSPFSSNPTGLVSCGSNVFFLANDPNVGRQPYASDGVAIEALPDFTSQGVSTIRNPLCAGGVLYFSGENANGSELWRSDGTAAGTLQLTELGPGSASSIPSPVGEVAGELVFLARTSVTGVWKLDASAPSGAVPLAAATTLSAYPHTPGVVLDGVLYFSFNDGQTGQELWCTDGTPGGTYRVIDLEPGLQGSAPNDFGLVNGLVHFRATAAFQTRLYVTDGTAAGTVDLGPTGFPQGRVTLADGSLAFFTSAGLWTSDGTAGGTVLAVPGPPTWVNNKSEAVAVDGGVCFTARGASSFSLYFSDGTPAGTQELLVVVPNNQPTPTLGLRGDGSAAWFPYEGEPWTSDGTPAGTRRVADISPPATPGSNPSEGVRLGDSLVFAAGNELGKEPWISDGTSAGTQLLLDIAPDGNSSPADFFEWRGRVYFSAATPPFGNELWVTDGTSAGTALFADLYPGNSSGFPGEFFVIGERLYFSATSATQGTEIWSTDGTPGGTAVALDLEPGAGSSLPAEFHRLGDAYLFAATVGGDRELWRTDGTAGGTFQVADLRTSGSSGPSGFASNGEVALFRGFTDGLGHEVFRTDGTQAGSFLLADIYTGPLSSGFWDIVVHDGTFVFPAIDDVFEAELWTSDGTVAGTSMLLDLNPIGPGFFRHDTPPFDPSLNELVLSGDRGFFWGDDGSEVPTLYVTDFTAVGTLPVASFADSVIERIWSVGGGRVALDVDDGVVGRELWISDGSAAGTELVADAAVTGADSSPYGVGRAGSRVFFAADDGVTGHELHAFDLRDFDGNLAEPYGFGCSLDGFPARLRASGTPEIDGSFTLEVREAPGSIFGVTAFSPVLEPALLVETCPIYLDNPVFWLPPHVVAADGTSFQPIGIPDDPAFVGVLVYFQEFLFELGGPIQDALSTTNALEILIGP